MIYLFCSRSLKRIVTVNLANLFAIGGIEWILLQEYLSEDYPTPQLIDENIPEMCKHPSTILRWWQPYQPDEQDRSVVWIIDNIIIYRSNNPLAEIYDPFRYT